MSDVVLEKIEKTYGNVAAVRQVDIDIRPGEFVTLLGPSGCGKTTCLRMVAGFVAPTSGRILMGGRDVTMLPAHRRNAGMVFQSYALFPHQTVAENIAFGLKVRRVGRHERDQRTAEALRLVRLEQFADRYPSQLSGGQKQRVALARAVVIRPDVLLLDEPLGALDLKLREELQAEIKRVQATLNMTTLFVTHDQGEALSMSDRIAVMRDGAIVQVASPNTLYERPNSSFVANFIGKTNLIEVQVVAKASAASYTVKADHEGGAVLEATGCYDGDFAVGERCLLATRPEHVRLGTHHANRIGGSVSNLNYLGNLWQVEVEDKHGVPLYAFVYPGENIPTRGEVVQMSWEPARCFLLKSER